VLIIAVWMIVDEKRRRKRRNMLTDDTSLPLSDIFRSNHKGGGDSHVLSELTRHVPGRVELNFVIINPPYP